MRYTGVGLIAVVALLLTTADAAWAQRVRFERTFDVPAEAFLDVSTVRGKIDITVGQPGRVVVLGTATVRWGLTDPTVALQLAKQVADNPPIVQEGHTVRLRPPSRDEERRAMTISYEVQVPKGMQVKTESDSGETTITGVGGRVVVETESAAITLQDLGGDADVITSSGAVRVDDVTGDLSVRTQSAGIALRGLGAGLRVRTQSGSVEASFRGQGLVDVETASSAIDLANVGGGLIAASSSGRIRVDGTPTAPWEISGGSGSFDVKLARRVGFDLDASSGSGSVRLDGLDLSGSASKGVATGAVAGGGPLVQARTRSGSIAISHR